MRWIPDDNRTLRHISNDYRSGTDGNVVTNRHGPDDCTVGAQCHVVTKPGVNTPLAANRLLAHHNTRQHAEVFPSVLDRHDTVAMWDVEATIEVAAELDARRGSEEKTKPHSRERPTLKPEAENRPERLVSNDEFDDSGEPPVLSMAAFCVPCGILVNQTTTRAISGQNRQQGEFSGKASEAFQLFLHDRSLPKPTTR